MPYSTRELLDAVINGANVSISFNWNGDVLDLRIDVKHDDFPETLALPMDRASVETFIFAVFGGMEARKRFEERKLPPDDLPGPLYGTKPDYTDP